jgi:alditol oxidase
MSSIPLTNWAGNVRYRAERVHRPGSLAELQAVVSAATRIRALGTGHSFNRVADTTGDLVRLDGLPGGIEIDSRRGRARVPAGLRYAQVAEELHRRGFALANLASLPHISVAGACATGTHGSGDGQRGLAAAVAGLRLVGPQGDLDEIDRDTPNDRLEDPLDGAVDGAVVGLGALGVVTHLDLDIEPTFEVAQRVWLQVPLDHLAANLDAVFGSAYSVSAFTTWRTGKAMVWQKYRLDQGEPAPPHGPGVVPADRPTHPIEGMSPEHCTSQLDAPGPWHERLPHFRSGFTPSAGDELQSELILPRTAAAGALAAMHDLRERFAPYLRVSEIRTIAADDLWLSPSHGRDSIAIHCTWVDDTPAVMPLVAAVEDRLLPLGARPHWGKLTATAPGDLPRSYPRAADFARLMAHRDPGGKFRNAFVDSVFPGPGQRLS